MYVTLIEAHHLRNMPTVVLDIIVILEPPYQNWEKAPTYVL